jgi:ABC-type transport system involved in multi-copper enzyme maturation permease subunit
MDVSPIRAWCYLVRFSFQRIARVRQLVGIAVALLLVACILVASVTWRSGWDRSGLTRSKNHPNNALLISGGGTTPMVLETAPVKQYLRENQPLSVFSRWVVFLVFLGFLLPLWSLSFAITALGSERENRTLIWLLTRPLPKWSIYLAKLLAVLPWCLAFNLGGFGLLCLCGGEVGQTCFQLFWPAVIGGTVAFTAAFHLIGSVFNRPSVVGLVYAFFFETILSELPVPGTMKRLSINYYTRCLMYAPAEEQNIPTESASLFVPVSESSAWLILIGIAVLLSLLGMRWFSRADYRDEV